jgi:hypothetical protein
MSNNWKKLEMINLQRLVKSNNLKTKKQYACCLTFTSLHTRKCMANDCPLALNAALLQPCNNMAVFKLLTEAQLKFCKSQTSLRKIGRKFENCIRDYKFIDLQEQNKIVIYNGDIVALLNFQDSSKLFKDQDDFGMIEDEKNGVKTYHYWEMKPLKQFWVEEIKGPRNEAIGPCFYGYFIQEYVNVLTSQGYSFIPQDDEEYFINC